MIEFKDVCKTYPGGVEAVKNLTMEVRNGETVVLLGTSGSGKTTTMKMVNRLIEPTGGRILIDGRDIMEQNAIELRRKIGYAIQSIGLFPHMTVADNIAVVPRLLNWSKQQIENRIEELLSMVGLGDGDFGRRFPSQLSGGQKQRVGVARALAADPPLVLMDEPFGALDPITREQLQTEFLELESEIQKTILFVTHDVFEAVRMGDRIALLDAGQLQQLSTPRELVESPANEFVDQFLGQHRFQLSLLTTTLGSLLEQLEVDGERPVRQAESLTVHSSLIDALDQFKRSDAERLAVFKRKEFFGNLQKRSLLRLITQTLGEAGG